MKPCQYSSKEYAKWLHETAHLPFDEACRMAGWSPRDEYRDAAIVFMVVVVTLSVVGSLLIFIPQVML